MRVLMTSTPGAGHVHPLVPLGLALVAAGHEVWWVTAPDACAGLHDLGFDARPAGLDLPERGRRLGEVFPEARQLAPRARRQVFGPMFAGVAAPAMADDLAPLFDEVRPDVVITEPAEMAGRVLAEVSAVPSVTVGFGGLIPDRYVRDAETHLAPLWARFGVEPAPDLGLYRHLYLHPFPPSLGRPPAGRPIRPMRPGGFDGRRREQAPPPWVATLGRDRPCVYATFGTEFAAQAPLGALIEASGSIDADVVLTVGPQVDPAALPGGAAHVRVERYVPQAFVLDRADAVVSHGGSGTLLGAATRGLPQLCLPIGADQFDNADALTDAGAGLLLEPDQRDADALRTALQAVLDDDRLRAGASTIADELTDMPTPDHYVSAIEALAG